jgi:transcriptional regulator with XRE-family HTH domain
MSIGHCYVSEMGAVPLLAVPPAGGRALHRLAAVRRQQGISRTAVARRLQIDVEEVRQQESEYTDLPLSTLYAWQSILDVPVAELLVEPGDELAVTVELRSQLLRLAKSVQMVAERTKQQSIRWMAQTMFSQLVEIMPELATIDAWNITGRPRRRSDLGVAAERRAPDDIFLGQDDCSQFYGSLAGEGASAGAALGTADCT